MPVLNKSIVYNLNNKNLSEYKCCTLSLFVYGVFRGIMYYNLETRDIQMNTNAF